MYLFWHLLSDYLRCMQKPASFTNTQASWEPAGCSQPFQPTGDSANEHVKNNPFAKSCITTESYELPRLVRSLRKVKQRWVLRVPAGSAQATARRWRAVCNWADCKAHVLTSTAQAPGSGSS